MVDLPYLRALELTVWHWKLEGLDNSLPVWFDLRQNICQSKLPEYFQSLFEIIQRKIHEEKNECYFGAVD